MEFIEITRENVNSIGDILYNIRENQQVAQGDVAAIMDKGQGQISSWEHNRKTPGMPNVVEYLRVVGGWKLGFLKIEE